MSDVQRAQLDGLSRSLKELSDSNQASLERVRTTLDASVRALQEGNEKKLEEMRKMVDERLHITLEQRLGESFKLVSDQLESVEKGLGEMQLPDDEAELVLDLAAPAGEPEPEETEPLAVPEEGDETTG